MSNWDHQRLLSLFAQVDGLDLLEGALKKRGALLLPHFGNFEILEVYMATVALSLYTISKGQIFRASSV